MTETEQPKFCPHCYSPQPVTTPTQDGLLCNHCNRIIEQKPEKENEK